MRPIRLMRLKKDINSSPLLPEVIVKADGDWTFSHMRFMYGESLKNTIANGVVHGIKNAG